ncbi:hypothetical protein [Anaerotalea alkaliphila]|uniref:Uncharacterized protein n=1 Tax=Anaerotalea alkaliphila TaxID=2662126 RepID=A0A7X5KMY7_9FIRM|nr:hypothetical protein [Anaerotalea alkaliphila]NDL67203.1 hypothetical protein [Anaerotalea alkaliphila]
MTFLYEMKDWMANFYRRYEGILKPFGKFLVSLGALRYLNAFFSLVPLLGSPWLHLLLAAVAAFVPATWFLLLLMVFTGAQLMARSVEAALIVFLGMVVLYLMFVRLQPDLAYLVLLVPLLEQWKLGILLPLVAGLFLSGTAVIPLGVGVVLYRMSAYVPGMLEIGGGGSTLYDLPEVMVGMYKYLSQAAMHDMAMLLTVLVFSAVVLSMRFVRGLPVRQVFYLAIAVGAAVNLLGFFLGSVLLKVEVSIGGLVAGTLVAGALTALFQFFRFSLDYQRSEKVQFEDDDHYYYVKVVPKVKLAKAVKEVKKIK